MSRWRDPQLLVSENYSNLTKWRSTVFKYCWLMSHFIFNMFKRWYLYANKKVKTQKYAAPAVKGLGADEIAGQRGELDLAWGYILSFRIAGHNRRVVRLPVQMADKWRKSKTLSKLQMAIKLPSSSTCWSLPHPQLGEDENYRQK